MLEYRCLQHLHKHVYPAVVAPGAVAAVQVAVVSAAVAEVAAPVVLVQTAVVPDTKQDVPLAAVVAGAAVGMSDVH